MSPAERYRALPDGPPWHQMFDGIIVEEPSPGDDHQLIAGNLCLILGGWAKRTRAGTVRIAPFDVWLSDRDVAQPDLMVILNERLDRLHSDGVHGAPDLVVEILSPSSITTDKVRKRALYAEAGVREMWLVDPVFRQVYIHRFDEGRQQQPPRIIGEHGTFASPLLPGLRIGAAKVFER